MTKHIKKTNDDKLTLITFSHIKSTAKCNKAQLNNCKAHVSLAKNRYGDVY